MILPLKPDSPLFGSESLSAIAAGVPVLVSSHSGIASLLETMYEGESIIRKSSTDSDINVWKDGILWRLLQPEDSQRTANRLRERFLLDTGIAQTHLDFIGTVGGKIYQSNIICMFHYMLRKLSAVSIRVISSNFLKNFIISTNIINILLPVRSE